MKITVSQLRRIIKEEIERTLTLEGGVGTKRVNMSPEEFLSSLTPEQKAAYEKIQADQQRSRPPGNERVILSPEEAAAIRGSK